MGSKNSRHIRDVLSVPLLGNGVARAGHVRKATRAAGVGETVTLGEVDVSPHTWLCSGWGAGCGVAVRDVVWQCGMRDVVWQCGMRGAVRVCSLQGAV